MSLGQWFGGRRGGRDPWMSGSPFSTDLWDPFVGSSLSQLDRGADETTALAYANVDWCETDKAHIFRADLPGVRKEDVKVHVEDDNVLQISGDRIKEQEEKTDRWHRVERSRGSFTRRFRLPENANLDEIKCELANGLLTVTVPKKEMEQPQKNVRPITIA